MASKLKLQTLQVFLLKKSIKEFGAALEDAVSLDSYVGKEDNGFTCALYVKNPDQKTPAWLEFLQGRFTETIDEFTTSITSAVLFVSAKQRVFAITFGYGRFLLKQDCMERNFGLRVVLNSIDADKLRWVDAHSVEEVTFHTRKNASRGTPVEEFGLDFTTNLMRGASGKPHIDARLGEMLAGKDSVQVSVRTLFPDLPKLCVRLLEASRQTTYRDRFAFIDYVVPITDPSIVAELDEILVEAMLAGNYDSLHMAPPEPYSPMTESAFTFESGDDPVTHADLAIEDYIAAKQDPDTLSVAQLKRDKVRVTTESGNGWLPRWSVYSCIVYEVKLSGRPLYVLSAGDWFEVDEDFEKRTAKKIKKLALPSGLLPSAADNQVEGAYNDAIGTQANFCCLDRRMVNLGGSKIEFCDLFSKAREIIHVKRKTSSATLSHLFSQGVVSARAMVSDAEFRERVRTEIGKVKSSFTSLIPKGAPDRTKFKIVYAILCPKKAKWPLSLPFFSQVNLAQASDNLAAMGLSCGLLHVEQKNS